MENDIVEQHRFDAYEIFTQLTDEEFIAKVKPYIKAFYKHEYGNELIIHEHDIYPEELYMYILVNREASNICFQYDKSDFTKNIDYTLENYKNDLKPKDILNFLIYEYKEIFSNPFINGYTNKDTKKEKIRL